MAALVKILFWRLRGHRAGRCGFPGCKGVYVQEKG